MKMISSRYAFFVAMLLVLALVPTILHSYLKAKTDDRVSVKTLLPVVEGHSSEPFTRHDSAWVKDMFDSQDWIERIYRDSTGKTLRLFVTRSYNHKRLYHHPELGLSHGNDLIAMGTVLLKGQRETPIHLLRGSNGRGVVAFALLSDGKFIENPVSYQIGNSLKQLVSVSRPMTLFYVSDNHTPNNVKFNQTSAALVLDAAIKGFKFKTQADAGESSR